MDDEKKSKDQLVSELRSLRSRIFEMENIISRQNHIHQEHIATRQLIHLMHSDKPTNELFQTLTLLLHNWSGTDAIGIRLKDGCDFPYYETRGFSEAFVLAENKLCAIDQHGEIIRSSDGNPVLECMCGNIICGRFDPSLPFFTEHGSFWTNSTSELLANTSETDRQSRTRNRCNGEGYESVALIPLHIGNERFGLLQFNDKRKGRFTPETLSLLEILADNLSLALANKLTARGVYAETDR